MKPTHQIFFLASVFFFFFNLTLCFYDTHLYIYRLWDILCRIPGLIKPALLLPNLNQLQNNPMKLSPSATIHSKPWIPKTFLWCMDQDHKQLLIMIGVQIFVCYACSKLYCLASSPRQGCYVAELLLIQTLRVHYAHAAANLNLGYSICMKVAPVHYFCTIALLTPFARVSVA